MTRALGDPHGARSLIHMPELVGIPNVASGTRIILASDGVWDVLTNEKCAKLIMGVADVQKAAHKLVTQVHRTWTHSLPPHLSPPYAVPSSKQNWGRLERLPPRLQPLS